MIMKDNDNALDSDLGGHSLRGLGRKYNPFSVNMIGFGEFVGIL